MSALVAAEIDGRKLADHEVLAYCFLLTAAGNETTRNATIGGALALIENPEQVERLRREPRLLRSATDEIVRWTSPIIHFCRTAAVDTELDSRTIRAGDTLVLFYPSSGRDEHPFVAAGPVRRRAVAQPARLVRHRRALLPGRAARAHRAGMRVPRNGRAHPRARARRPDRAPALDRDRRREAHAGEDRGGA